MTDKYSVGSILRRLREEKRKKWIEKDQWTQTAVARRIGVSRVTYIAWENDEWPPDVKNLKRIIEVFRPSEKDELALYRTAGQAAPRIFYLPLKRNRSFIGRETTIEPLRQYLQRHSIIIIHGLAGVGKTDAAVEYAHNFHPTVYRTVLWVDARDTPTLQASYDLLAREVLNLPERDEPEQDRRVQAVKRWLETHTGWLLIMDGVNYLPVIPPFLPAELTGHILLTTRSQTIGRFASALLVQSLETDEGVFFLLRRSGMVQSVAEFNRVSQSASEAARQLVVSLRRYTLALEQAAAYIRETGVSFTDYLKLCEETRRAIINDFTELGTDYDEDGERFAVGVTTRIALDKMLSGHPGAVAILCYCSFLSPDLIPKELLYYDELFKHSPEELTDRLNALERYSLVHEGRDSTFSLHITMQAIFIGSMPLDMRKETRDRGLRALNAAFPVPEPNQWVRCQRLLPHVLVCADWIAKESTPPVESVRLLEKASLYLTVRGHYADAESLAAQALAIAQRVLGNEHPFVADGLEISAIIYMLQDRVGLAKARFREAFAIREKNLGAQQSLDHFRLGIMAASYVLHEDYEEAESLLLRELSVMEQQLGPEHPDIAECLQTLAGVIYHPQGNYERAESLYRRALAIWDKFLEAEHFEHPQAAECLLGLALLLQKQERYEGIDAMYKRAFSIRKQLLGAAHPHTLQARKQYAAFLRSADRHAEAAKLEASDGLPE